jgi:hypothetical protein
MFKKILLVLGFSLLTSSAFAACTNPLPILNGSSGMVNMSVSQNTADAGCMYNITPNQGGAPLSATNGWWTNILQGNAALSATNGLYANILQGNVANSAANPFFFAPATSSVWSVSVASGAAVDGWDVTKGTKSDAPCASGSTTPCTVEARLAHMENLLAGPVPLGSASGGMSVKTLPALTNTAISVKAAAGQVYKGQCSNADTTHWAYLQLFNVAAASVTMGTTAPADFVGIPPGSNTGFTLSLVGEQFSTAISAGVASSSTGGTAPTTTLDCTVAFN